MLMKKSFEIDTFRRKTPCSTNRASENGMDLLDLSIGKVNKRKTIDQARIHHLLNGTQNKTDRKGSFVSKRVRVEEVLNKMRFVIQRFDKGINMGSPVQGFRQL